MVHTAPSTDPAYIAQDQGYDPDRIVALLKAAEKNLNDALEERLRGFPISDEVIKELTESVNYYKKRLGR